MKARNYTFGYHDPYYKEDFIKPKTMRFIWFATILACILLSAIGWLLWETFKANMYK